MRDDRERLLDMLEAIRKIEQVVSDEKYAELVSSGSETGS